MKIFKAIILISILSLIVSCTENFTKPTNLVGTTWKSTDFTHYPNGAYYDYVLIKFTSTTNYEGWIKHTDDVSAVSEITDTYLIKENTITFGTGSTGTINGTKLTYFPGADKSIYTVFDKQ